MPKLPHGFPLNTSVLRSKSTSVKNKSNLSFTPPSSKNPSVGLALAGGGFLGAAYELGVLAALCESINGLDLNALRSYVGVSAGGYVAAGLANGMTPHQMIRLFVEAEDSQTPVAPERMLKPAYKHLLAAGGNRRNVAPGLC
jgi:NTE family protein